MISPRERLTHFKQGVGRLAEAMPQTMQSLLGFIGAAQAGGALSIREKELIAIGISMYHRCEDCIVVHADAALRAGCSRQEILEAAGMSMVFGGGPSLGASASLLLDALDAFEQDLAAEAARGSLP